MLLASSPGSTVDKSITLDALGEKPLRRDLHHDSLGLLEDWQGSTIALACPVCLKFFIVSGMIHRKGRECPSCGKSKAFV
jgi:hypothetical protein